MHRLKIVLNKLPFNIGYLLQLVRYRIKIKNKFNKLHGYDFNLNKPRLFSEKIFYRKYFGNMKTMSLYADKLRVRTIVQERLGEEFLIPLLGVYSNITLEDLIRLPNSFVLKTNHGSGSSHLMIVKDKSKVDLKSIVYKMNQALKEPFGLSGDEKFYSIMDRFIIAEEYIESDGQGLTDYKFHCFKGHQPLIAVDVGRFSSHQRGIFDCDWNKTEIKFNEFDDLQSFPRPKNLSKMIDAALLLSEEFDYVRIDLYNINGKVYFGEITQTPANGMEKISPFKYQQILGDMWPLDKNNNYLYRGDNI